MFNETLLLPSSSLSRTNVPALLTFSLSRDKTKSYPLLERCPEPDWDLALKSLALGFSSTYVPILETPLCNKECS